jgi:hypothetical protein
MPKRRARSSGAAQLWRSPQNVAQQRERRPWLRPILEPSDAWRRRVLDLEPRLAGSRTVGMIAMLADDALGAEPAGVGEDRRPIALKVLAVLDPSGRLVE